MIIDPTTPVAKGQEPTDPGIAQAINGASYHGLPFIGGRFVDPVSQQSRVNSCPATGQRINSVADCDAADVDAAVASSESAFEGGWRDMAPADRKRVLLDLVAAVESHADELAALDSVDVGKPTGVARAVDLNSALRTFAWYAEACDKVYGEVAPTAGYDVIVREPLGVVAAIVPWNYPLMIAAWKLAPILAAGNTAVLKPAEQSPLSALRLGEIAVEAGLPPGVLNVVPGAAEAGRSLGLHPRVAGVAFTGSTDVGKQFFSYAAQSTMKAISLECGGKSACIVHADVDIPDAMAKLAAGLFYNAGQSCNAPTRLLVHESRASEAIDALRTEAAKYLPNNPFAAGTQVGAIVSAEQLDRIEGFVNRANDAGAALLVGGERCYPDSGGFYYAPTVIGNVTEGSEIAQEEIFGPVLPVETYRDPEEALRLANNTRYGLWANVFTNDFQLARWLGRRLKAGTVGFNMTFGGDITTPFGGFKESGVGRDRSLHALHKFTQIKHLAFGS